MKTTDTERCINFSERFGMSTIIADARAELAAMQERIAKLESALDWNYRSLCAFLDYAPASMSESCYDPHGAISAARAILKGE